LARKATSEHDSHTIAAKLELGQHYAMAGQPKAAVALLEPVLAEMMTDSNSKDSREFLIAQRSEGEALVAFGRRDQGRHLLMHRAAGLRKLLGPGAIETRRSSGYRPPTHRGGPNHGETEPLYLRGPVPKSDLTRSVAQSETTNYETVSSLNPENYILET
jgi:hypothetical protein